MNNIGNKKKETILLIIIIKQYCYNRKTNGGNKYIW